VIYSVQRGGYLKDCWGLQCAEGLLDCCDLQCAEGAFLNDCWGLQCAEVWLPERLLGFTVCRGAAT
jgi:hypothetical protein